jgi:broad specificity phosphatase PhoE
MDAERAKEIAVVAHGGTLRVLNAYLRGIPVERMRWEPLTNGCILRSPAGWPDRITSPDEKE